ncbi:Rrf2 family transcriptional regulator [Paenibacillus sp. sgz500958]|uniref:Rrf2 family transcriptional regulator n=1 Tax=Paenibacillus sp. sgz500958 TaxID=3242475 RepID=UPI0036D29251
MAAIKRFGFGVQALIILASNTGQCSSEEIASHINCEPTALRKILVRLTETGLIKVKQGRGGGYTLAKQPKDIALVEVYHAVLDESPQWLRMLDTTGDHLFGTKMRESFGKIMNDIHGQIDLVLQSYTIADLIE